MLLANLAAPAAFEAAIWLSLFFPTQPLSRPGGAAAEVAQWLPEWIAVWGRVAHCHVRMLPPLGPLVLFWGTCLRAPCCLFTFHAEDRAPKMLCCGWQTWDVAWLELLARTAKHDTAGALDWSPHLPTLFSRIMAQFEVCTLWCGAYRRGHDVQ
jgi:hypothetical protein